MVISCYQVVRLKVLNSSSKIKVSAAEMVEVKRAIVAVLEIILIFNIL